MGWMAIRTLRIGLLSQDHDDDDDDDDDYGYVL
jgi:hypothetical protein